MQTMKCVIKEDAGPGHIKLVSRPIPKPGAREVLARAKAAAGAGI